MSEIENTAAAYDPAKVVSTMNGRVLVGFAPEGVISIVRNADSNALVVGCQGDAAFTVNADRSATATLQFMGTSASLAFIRDLAARNTPVRLTVMDANDFDAVKVDAEGCRIQKMPDYTRNKEQSSVSVTIIIPYLEYR